MGNREEIENRRADLLLSQVRVLRRAFGSDQVVPKQIRLQNEIARHRLKVQKPGAKGQSIGG